MSALVCLYVIGITALVAAAAAAIEWAVQGRVPTRYLWSAAMVCALLIPPLAIVQHARGIQQPAVRPAQSALVEVVQLSHAAGAALGSRERGSPMHTLRDEYHAVADRVSTLRARTILELWIVASLALSAWIVYGAMYWHRERRAWEAIELDGVTVHLSEETGPAVLGVLSQRIVLPAWVRTLAPEYRQLMLAHECEHIAARDPQRLALALGALVLMPWNPALWWCAARMRRAIELDCDARVLRRHPSPRAYGYLLLQVAARGNNVGPLAVPFVNLLRLPSELELRLRAMTRPRTIGGRTALAGTACAVAAVSAAFTAPVPASTRPTIRNLVQATRARVAHGERAVVRVGSAVLELDSATASADGSRVRGRLRELRILPVSNSGATDTIPAAVTEDSLRRLARALAERTRQVDSMRARMDSMAAALRTRDVPSREHAGVRSDTLRPDSALIAAMSGARELAGRDSMTTAMKRYVDWSAPRINAALKRYYPNLATDATPNTVIWFLVDPAGNVVQTVRKEKRSVVSPVTAAAVFANVDAGDIGLSSIMEWSLGGRHFSVAWIGLKR